jgi:hypothetical protein
MATESPPGTGSIPYVLEYLCTYTATLDTNFEVIGPVPEGIRVNAYFTGGEVIGPRLRGSVRPVGADWLTVRSDGVSVLDVRTTIQTEDGALIYLTLSGVIDGGEDGYQKFLAGEGVPDGTPIRATPRFTTAHPSYQWLNRLHCLNVGEIVLSQGMVRYDVYAVR